MKSILVTGGSGLVGHALRGIKSNYYMYFLDSKMCNLLNFEETLKTFKEIKPDYVIHLAACVGGLYKNMNDPVKMLENNIIINTNVIKCSHLIDVQRLIACLSTCIFPDNVGVINESMINDGPPHPSNEGYAYSKRILEAQCKCYNKQYNRNYICIIPTNIYGPHDNFNLEDSHVIPALIHKCYLNKLFYIKGTGKPRRQFIYSKDLAKIIMEILLKYSSTESMIIADTKEYSILEIANIINTSFSNTIILQPEYSDGQYRKTADNSRLLSFLPNFKFTPIHDGLLETINWFKKEYPGIRK